MTNLVLHANRSHGKVGIGTFINGVQSSLEAQLGRDAYAVIQSSGREWLKDRLSIPQGSAYFGTETYDFLPWKSRRVRQGVAVHDLLLADKIGGANPAVRAKCKALIRRLAMVDVIVCVSDDTRSRLPSRARQRAFTAHPGVSPEYWAEAQVAPYRRREYFLALGARHPRKRLQMLINAFIEYRRRGGRTKLVIATSHVGPWPDGVSALAAATDSELVRLMTGAKLLLFPSEAEGFGLPLLEAAVVGTPSLTTLGVPASYEDDAVSPLADRLPVGAGVAEWASALGRADMDGVPSKSRPSFDNQARWNAVTAPIRGIAEC